MSILSTNTKLIKVGQEYSAGSGISIDDYVISVTATLTGDYASQSAFDELSDSFSSLSSNINTNSGVWDDVVNKLYISSYHELSAGANTDIQGYVISSRNWTPDITYTSESAYQRATNYTDTQISSLSGEVSAEVSHLSSDIDYISGVALTSHQSLEGYLTKASGDEYYQPIGSYATVSQLESTSGDITALIPDTSNFITNSSAEATYQPIGNYLSSNALEGYATNESLDTASSFLSGAIDYVSANVGENIPVSNSGDLYKVGFDGVDLYGYKSTSSIPYHVYSAVSSTDGHNEISPSVYPAFVNGTFASLNNWSAFDIISISSDGNGVRPVGYPYGVTALDVYYNASYLYDYNNNRLEDFSGYIGKITHDSLVVTSYFDKPSYYNNIARCNNFTLWFSGNKNQGLINNHYICSVGNKVESGTSKVEGIIVPGTVDLSPYYTTADANTLSSMLSGAIDYVSANAGKVYEGVSPIVVNNTEDKISADTWTFSAGSNVSFFEDDVNKISRIDCTVTGYNETVLWSGNLYQVSSSNEQLSESITSFNSLKLYGYWRGGDEGAAMQVFEFEPRYNSYSATFLDPLWTYRKYDTGLVYENLMRVNLRDNQMALDSGWAQTGSNSFQYNTNVTSYDFALCKVVGVNRKQ